MSEESKVAKVSFLTSSKVYFLDVVTLALEKRKISTSPQVGLYLVDLLEANLTGVNLLKDGTLAEMLLKAARAEKSARIDILKRLGDTSLYMSGFFGDSLRRKIVDIDYYADMGGVAYATLASEVGSDIQSHVYNEFSRRFLEFVDLLSYISQNSLVQSNQDLLRLYERYVMTGSELAREQLMEKGLLTPDQLKKSSNQ